MAIENPAAGGTSGASDPDAGAAALPVRDAGVVMSLGDAVRSLSFAVPKHPILVHYTIALTTASLAFDTLGRVLQESSLAATGWWTLVASVIATVLTLATGVVSRLGLDIGEGQARSYLRLHMALGPTFFAMLVATAAWRAILWSDGREVGWWYLTALAATVAVMGIQGYAGGELVYRWGADVEGRHRDLRQRRAGEAPPPLPGGGESTRGAAPAEW